jgi:exodeoxyribonuclease (lambda-induced)
MALWLLGRKWCDLILWAPDLEAIGRHITIIRIDRDDNAIDALESDLLAFDRVVEGYRKQLEQAA